MGFEYIDHTADIQVHAWGSDIQQCFEQTVIAMMNVMTNTDEIGEFETVEIELSAPDKEILLVDYLTEYLFIFDTKELLFSRVQVDRFEYNEQMDEYRIHSKSYGEQLNREKHELKAEVKAVTFSYLEIEEKEEKTELWVVLDL